MGMGQTVRRKNGSQQRLLPLLWTGHLIEKKLRRKARCMVTGRLLSRCDDNNADRFQHGRRRIAPGFRRQLSGNIGRIYLCGGLVDRRAGSSGVSYRLQEKQNRSTKSVPV